MQPWWNGEVTSLIGDLPIIAPETITAGQSVIVRVGPVEAADGVMVGLVLIGKHGPHVYRAAFMNGMAEFTIPGEHTRHPGSLALIAASGEARGEASVLLRPIHGSQRTDLIAD
ncbi:MAG: hypothetical protein MUF87_00455 [Anaerolineae bacterium]|nr:hypothetical protein [Anaerolineae bacterium]